MYFTDNHSSANDFLFWAFFPFWNCLVFWSQRCRLSPPSPSASTYPAAFCQSLSGLAPRCSWCWRRNTPYTRNSDSVNMLGPGSQPHGPDTGLQPAGSCAWKVEPGMGRHRMQPVTNSISLHFKQPLSGGTLALSQRANLSGPIFQFQGDVLSGPDMPTSSVFTGK